MKRKLSRELWGKGGAGKIRWGCSSVHPNQKKISLARYFRYQVKHKHIIASVFVHLSFSRLPSQEQKAELFLVRSCSFFTILLQMVFSVLQFPNPVMYIKVNAVGISHYNTSNFTCRRQMLSLENLALTNIYSTL